MEAKQKREYVISYLKDTDLISDEAVDILLKLMNGPMYKNDLFEIVGYKHKSKDTAYPQQYADQIREIYPEFNNGWHFYDYSEKPYGEMRNLYNLFAKKILEVFRHG